MWLVLLTSSDNRNHFTITVKIKFDALIETSEKVSPNKQYENIATTFIEAAAESIQSKPNEGHGNLGKTR